MMSRVGVLLVLLTLSFSASAPAPQLGNQFIA
jgi:hypothetical protein